MRWKKNRFKAHYWDGEGFWLLYKRFENGNLAWPNTENEVKALSDEQVECLLKGFPIYPKIKEINCRQFYWIYLLFIL